MCFGSKGESPGARRNEEIEKQLRQDKKKAAKEVKLLLLGITLCQYHVFAR